MNQTVGKSLTQSYVSRGCIIPHLIVVKTKRHSLHTHSLFEGIEAESAPCHLGYAERKAQAFLLNKDIHVG